MYCVHFINAILKQIFKKGFTVQQKYAKQSKRTLSKLTTSCANSTLKTLEKGVKYVQRYQ